jgi:hypothetical protein
MIFESQSESGSVLESLRHDFDFGYSFLEQIFNPSSEAGKTM